MTQDEQSTAPSVPSAQDAGAALKMLETMKSQLGGVLAQIGGAKKRLKKHRKSRRNSRRKSRRKSRKKGGRRKRRKSRRKRKSKRR